jgi:hypothetical protein
MNWFFWRRPVTLSPEQLKALQSALWDQWRQRVDETLRDEISKSVRYDIQQLLAALPSEELIRHDTAKALKMAKMTLDRAARTVDSLSWRWPNIQSSISDLRSQLFQLVESQKPLDDIAPQTRLDELIRHTVREELKSRPS